jgi:hypothetical protein
MIDVKKLITGFLILATAAVCSGLLISFVSNSSKSSAAVVPPQATLDQTASSSLGENAFLPQEPLAPIAVTTVGSTTILASSSADPNNLTDVLATAFVNGVDVANPDGPVDDNGLSVIAHPDEQEIANEVADVPALNNVATPNWDFEAASQPIKTTTSSSPQDVANYTQELSNVVNTNLVASNVENIITATTPDPNQVSFVDTQIQATLSQTLALPTPQPLVAFQKSLVKVLIYEKNELQLVENVGDDPLKASIILQNEKSNYDAAAEQLETNLKKASSLNGFSFGGAPQQSESAALAFFNAALGIPTAHAQFAGVVFDPDNFAEWIESFAESLALQILKNILIALIQKKVLAWVQGSGAPRFITNWGSTLINSYEQTAIGAINSQMSCGVFPAFLPQIKVTLGSFYKPTQNSACANQFQAALGANTFQQFYNHFSNGGFIAYGASQLPSGNPYGGLFFQAQIVDNTAQQGQAATLAKTTSANGLKGDDVCGDGSNPNTGEHTVCENPDGPDYTINAGAQTCPGGLPPDLDGTCAGGGTPSAAESCGDGDTPVVYANAGTSCDDGSNPSVTTPGNFTSLGFAAAVDGTPEQVAAANDIAGLLNSVLGSLLNSLAGLAVNAVNGAVNGALNPGGGGVVSIPSSTIVSGQTSSTIQTVALGCNPPAQNVSSTFPATLGAVGGTNDANGNAPTYTWTDSIGNTGAGYIFSPIYNLPGTYTVTVNDSTNDPPATCTVVAH